MADTLTKPEKKGLSSLWDRDPFLTLRDEVDSLFSRFTGELGGGRNAAGLIPSLDIAETDSTVELRMDLPGIKPEDVDIQLAGNTITISGERKEEKEEKKGNGRSFHRIERRSGSFSRTVALPCNVNPEKAEAACKEGVLTVTLPKSESARTRKITIKK